MPPVFDADALRAGKRLVSVRADAQGGAFACQRLEVKVQIVVRGQVRAARGMKCARDGGLAAAGKIAQGGNRQECQQDESQQRHFPHEMVAEGFAAVAPDPAKKGQISQAKEEVGIKRGDALNRADIGNQDDVGNNPAEYQGVAIFCLCGAGGIAARMICAAPAWLEHAPPIHTPADLTRQRWLHHLPLHLEMQHGEARYLLDVEDSLYCNQLAAVRVLCEAGLGLALILDGEAAAALACGRLQRVLPEWTLPAVSIYAVTPHRVQAAKIAAVLAILRETFAG